MSPDTDRAAGTAAWLGSARTWVRAWSPAVPLRWLGRHRLVCAGLLALGALLVAAAGVQADSGTGAEGGSAGDPLISWMGITDSRGVPVAKYTLTLNEGSVSKPWMGPFAGLASLVYEGYRNLAATALWLIRTVLSFKWLDLFAGPFSTIGDGITGAMNRYGLAATALAILAIIATITALAGKAAKAASNIAMGLLMVGIAATVFAHPLSQMIGADGLLAKGRETGLAIASTVSGGKNIANTDELVASLADRFLRTPTQMVNFGLVSDSISRRCEQAWSKGITAGRDDALKDDMKACDSKKGEQMHANSMGNPIGILASVGGVALLGLLLIAFAGFFVWHVIRTAVHALLYAALAPPAFALGVIPGAPQMFAWKTVLDCAMAYLAMIIYTAAFGGYNAVLDHVFTWTPNAIEAIFLTALVLAFGFAFFSPLRRMFDGQRDTLAARMSSGGSSAASRGGGFSPAAQASRFYRNHLQNRATRATTAAADALTGALRTPGRVDTETAGGRGPVPERSDGSAAPEPPDGDNSPTPTSPADGPAGSSTAGAAAAAGSSQRFGAGGPSGRVGTPAHRPAPQPVVYLSPARGAGEHDRLAGAIHMQRGTRPGSPSRPGPGGPGGGVRHSLSEAA